jgi:hypothetical protein
MTGSELKRLIGSIPEEKMPDGHAERFRSRLYSSVPLQHKLWKLQKVLIAASVTLLMAGSLTVIVNHSSLFFKKPMLAAFSPELKETENYYENQIEYKIKILSNTAEVDQHVIKDLRKEDKTFRSMRRDLRKNPGDIRLTCAVLETYQRRIDILDNMIAQYR